MIADIFVLKKNAWHAKLMKWVWGYEYYEFRNMCPYFWLSVFNCVFIVPISIIYFLKKVVVSFLGLIDDWKADYDARCQYKEQQARRQLLVKFEKLYEKEELTEEDILFLQRANKHAYNSKSSNYFKPMGETYRYLSWDIRDKFDKVLDKIESKIWDEKREKERLEEKLELERKKRIEEFMAPVKKNSAVAIAQMTILVKFILKLFAGTALVGAGYLGYLGVQIATTWNWSRIGAYFLFYGFLTVVVVLGIISAYILIRWLILGINWLICKYGDYCIPCYTRRRAIGKFFGKVGNVLLLLLFPLVVLWSVLEAIWSGLKLLWQVIVAMKQNNCPGIEWKD